MSKKTKQPKNKKETRTKEPTVNRAQLSGNYNFLFVQYMMEKVLTGVLMISMFFIDFTQWIGNADTFIFCFRGAVILYFVVNFIEMIILIFQFSKKKYLTPNAMGMIKVFFKNRKK